MIWRSLFLLVARPAHGAGPDLPATESERAAEYNRLRADLRRYAQKQMWTAVERTYSRCMELYPDPEPGQDRGWAPPTPMEQSDHLHGAHAASSRGDLYQTRLRLVRAVRKDQTAEALDWLWAIDTTYSEVRITARPGTPLTPVNRPFDPVLLQAIDHATTVLAETGEFHGLLPRIVYQVADTRLEVRGGEGLVELDLTGRKRKKNKMNKKRRDR